MMEGKFIVKVCSVVVNLRGWKEAEGWFVCYCVLLCFCVYVCVLKWIEEV